VRLADLAAGLDRPALGARMYGLVEELYPVPRSITGEGLRRTLRRLGEEAPLALHEVPSGTPVLDWTVPREWNVREAWVAGPDGRRVIDVRDSSLHLVGYSVPVRARLPLAALRPHLHTLPEHPDWIPFRTSYYRESWGFCLRHRDLERLPEGEYEVVVDTTLADGALTYGEAVLPGETTDEVLLSTHACHPALCNDNLSGLVVCATLARLLAGCALRYSYRFVFVPGTIGSITWLARHEASVDRIAHGLVVAGVGDPGPFTYKRSRRGRAEIDRVAAHVLRHAGRPHEVMDFVPWGYDERQYCSPGFDLPVGCLSRTPHGRYPQYHTSADDLALVTPAALADSLAMLLELLAVLEDNRRYRSTNPKGEPQLGRRGLFRTTGGAAGPLEELPLLWTLNLADGEHALLDVAERAGLPFAKIRAAAGALAGSGLLKECA
jgi:aminopeptidase-like protein